MKQSLTPLALLAGLSLSSAPRVFGIVAALVLPLAFAAPVGASSVSATVGALALGGYGQDYNQFGFNSLAGTLTPGQTVESLAQADYGADSYFARSLARADYGSLGVSAQTIMVNNTDNATRTVQLVAYAISSWSDTFTIASGDAPVGTPVSILATAVVDIGELSRSFSENAALNGGAVNFYMDGLVGCLSLDSPNANGPGCGGATPLQVGRNVFSFEIQTTVGGVYTSGATLIASVSVEDGVRSGFSSASLLADVFNSANSYYTVLTPGATLQSASGYSYTVPVPEAQTYALMLAGLGLIGWRVRRRG